MFSKGVTLLLESGAAFSHRGYRHRAACCVFGRDRPKHPSDQDPAWTSPCAPAASVEAAAPDVGSARATKAVVVVAVRRVVVVAVGAPEVVLVVVVPRAAPQNTTATGGQALKE